MRSGGLEAHPGSAREIPAPREYCFPVLQQVLAAMAPGGARRYQHSDSAMGHLLDQQRELGINSVNYGPSIDAALIRAKMPDAVINGHTPPLLLRNGSPEAIRARVIGDFEKAGATGGLIVTTAGSVDAGTGVGRLRWFMKLVQDYCRYDESRGANPKSLGDSSGLGATA